MPTNLVNGKCQTLYEFTPAQIATMRTLYESGTPYRAIAVAVGLSETAYKTIERKCKAFGKAAVGKRAAAIAYKRL